MTRHRNPQGLGTWKYKRSRVTASPLSQTRPDSELKIQAHRKARYNCLMSKNGLAGKLVICLAAVVSVCQFGNDASAQSKNLVIRQKDAFAGATTVYLNKSAIRVEFGSPECCLIANAPQWHITLFNKRNRNGLSMSLDQWLQHIPHWPMSIEDNEWMRSISVLKSAPCRLQGQNCEVYRFAYRDRKGTIHPKTYGVQGTVYLTKHELAPEEACSILRRIYCVPKEIENGLPLRVALNPQATSVSQRVEGLSLKVPRGSTSESLFTNSIEVKSNSPAIQFKAPARYNPVKHENQVLIDKTYHDGSKLLLEFMK